MKSIVLAAAVLGIATAALAEPVTIGVVDDMSGVYADFNGPGLITAVKMAIEQKGGQVLGRKIEVVSIDPEEKPINAATAVGKWIDEDHASMILEGTTSAIALAIQNVAEQKKTIFFALSGTSALTNESCSAYGIQYMWNNYAMAHGVGNAEAKPGDKWFFLTADYTFGKTLEAETAGVVTAAGAKVVGSVNHPLASSDFSSYLLQAQSVGSTVLGLANAGRDTQNALLQAHDFHMDGAGMKIQPLIMFDTDVRGVGLPTAQGIQYLTGFYWDQSDAARRWSQAFFERQHSMPTMNQAGAYSATLEYLNAAEKAGSFDADKVRAALGTMPIDDPAVAHGTIRDNGSLAHDMFLMQVKAPAESHDRWDIAKTIRTIPANQAFQPLEDSTCKLLKHS